MADVHVVGGAAGVGRIDMAELQAHVFDHRQAAQARRITRGAKIAIYVALAEPCVFKGALRNLSMQLRQRLVRRFACGVFISTDDVSLAFETHSPRSSSLGACLRRSGLREAVWTSLTRLRMPDPR